MLSSSAPSGASSTWRSALGRRWAQLTAVSSPDLIRARLNTAFAKLIVIFIIALTGLVISEIVTHQATSFVVFAGSVWLVCVIVWWLNRKGMVIGHLIFGAYTIIGLSLITSPENYAGPEPIVQSQFVGIILLMTLFVSPRWGLVTCFLQLAVLILRALFADIPLEHVVLFSIIAGFNLPMFTAIIMHAASTLTRALRDSHRSNTELERLNAELEQRVADRTAELQAANHRIQAANVALYEANQRTQAANEQLRVANEQLERRAQQRAKDTQELVHDATGLLGVVNSGIALLPYNVPDTIRPQLEHETLQLHPTITLLHTMLSATLDAARLEAHTLTIDDRNPANLRAVVETVSRMLEPRFTERHIAYTITIAPETPNVRGDEVLLLRVLLNLLLNAIKFTEPYHADDEGGKVELEIGVETQWVVLRVMDNGPGVPLAALANLAQRFSRAVQGNSAPQGTGIGLHAVAGIIGLHGGTMTIDSPGEGQGFSVTIRLLKAISPSVVARASTITATPLQTS